jgi:hypothetical protein
MACEYCAYACKLMSAEYCEMGMTHADAGVGYGLELVVRLVKRA